MMTPKLTAAILSTILSASAFAQESAPPAPAPAPAKEKRVCKSAASIGSLVQQRTCHTVSEWKAINAANDRSMQQMREENTPGTNQTPQ